MPDAISNTSPLLYLHRIGAVDWLSQLFSDIWIPGAVLHELQEGQRQGYNVPQIGVYSWIHVMEPRAVPSEWLTLDLGAGELAVMALALENPDRIVILDDGLARRIAQAAGLTVWGTLKVILQGKACGLTESVEPLLNRLIDAGMWISNDVRRRVLTLAGEEGDWQ